MVRSKYVMLVGYTVCFIFMIHSRLLLNDIFEFLKDSLFFYIQTSILNKSVYHSKKCYFYAGRVRCTYVLIRSPVHM